MNAVEWKGDSVVVLDQRKLPIKEIYNTYIHFEDVARSITDMEVRGAPAIGITAAMGIALAAKQTDVSTLEDFRAALNQAFEQFAQTRPTAVNLFWAINRMKKILADGSNIEEIRKQMEDEAVKIHKEDIESCKEMGKHGAAFIEDGDVVMTHCNAGALATGGYGTALGVIRAAIEDGKKIEVYACETRPYLQGARLTAWELYKDEIPVTLITDNMAAHFIQKGIIKKIVVGADRIVENGDVANKIGTYGHSVIAKEHGIPFYVAAPISTLDPDTENGDGIVIEERSINEVAFVGSEQIAPEGISIKNPAFDVTPAENITAIFTERGVIEKPDREKVRKHLGL